MRNIALHDLTLIKLTVSGSVCIGSFLTRYSNGHKKQTHRELTL